MPMSEDTEDKTGKGKSEQEKKEKKKTSRASAAPDTEMQKNVVDRLTDVAESAFSFATKGSMGSLKLSRALLSKTPTSIKAMQEAGSYLKDLREVAGLTQKELSEALDLRDESALQALEAGTSTMSFELILRLAALFARHDPIPFVMRFTRTYRPDLWKILDGWGLGRVPVQFERERHFINMYRKHDAARRLSDEAFDKVVKFTDSAFEAALHFAAEHEGVGPERPKKDDESEPDADEAEEAPKQT